MRPASVSPEGYPAAEPSGPPGAQVPAGTTPGATPLDQKKREPAAFNTAPGGYPAAGPYPYPAAGPYPGGYPTGYPAGYPQGGLPYSYPPPGGGQPAVPAGEIPPWDAPGHHVMGYPMVLQDATMTPHELARERKAVLTGFVLFVFGFCLPFLWLGGMCVPFCAPRSRRVRGVACANACAFLIFAILVIVLPATLTNRNRDPYNNGYYNNGYNNGR